MNNYCAENCNLQKTFNIRSTLTCPSFVCSYTGNSVYHSDRAKRITATRGEAPLVRKVSRIRLYTVFWRCLQK